MQLPDPWGAYLRLQSELDGNPQITNRSWGLEAALDAIVAAQPSHAAILNLEATAASAGRRDRHRARLRRMYQSALAPTVDQPAAIEARVEIEQLRRRLCPVDWQLISSIAVGMDYREIGKDIGAKPSSLRIRVMRIRDSLRLAA